MVNYRQWLDSNYPKKERRGIVELDISNNELEGSLKLNGFDNLKKLCCSGNNLTGLNVSNCTQLEELDCSDNKLSSLNLNNCSKLKELDFSFNNLTNLGLDLPSLKELKRIYCSNNCLTDLDFSFFGDELIALNIKNNNLFFRDLSCFNQFVNLKLLWIGNDDEERLRKSVYNRFEGSLNSLEKLVTLESLDVSNTSIIGSGDLPNSVKIVGLSKGTGVERIKHKKSHLEETKELNRWRKSFGNLGRTPERAFEEFNKLKLLSNNEKDEKELKTLKKLLELKSEQELPNGWDDQLVKKEQVVNLKKQLKQVESELQEKRKLQEKLKKLLKMDEVDELPINWEQKLVEVIKQEKEVNEEIEPVLRVAESQNKSIMERNKQKFSRSFLSFLPSKGKQTEKGQKEEFENLLAILNEGLNKVSQKNLKELLDYKEELLKGGNSPDKDRLSCLGKKKRELYRDLNKSEKTKVDKLLKLKERVLKWEKQHEEQIQEIFPKS